MTDAIDLLKEMKFVLIYVIISGNLAEEFFKEYIKIVNGTDIKVICATIVFCSNVDFHKSKPYYMDPFLNPRGVTNDFMTIINYTTSDECNWSFQLGKNEKVTQELVGVMDFLFLFQKMKKN